MAIIESERRSSLRFLLLVSLAFAAVLSALGPGSIGVGLTSGTWNTEIPMPSARGHLATATGADGRIYAIGGYDGHSYLMTIEAYDPVTHGWLCSTGDT